MAFLTNISFTDPQGTVFADATFGVSYASRSTVEYGNLRRNMTDMVTMTEDTTPQGNVNVQYYYCADEAKRVEGKAHYILANVSDPTKEPTMSFAFDSTCTDYDHILTEEMCCHYLTTIILLD